MPIPTVVRSTDPGAPSLNGLPGSAYEVMKHSLDLCGWTLEFDDPENFTCVFRNNPITGSGCYIRVRDDGLVGTSSFHGRLFEMILYEDMSDVDTGTGPHVTEANGVFMKSFFVDERPREWIIIGDDRTVYLSCQDTLSTETASSSSPKYSLMAFGDYENWFAGLPGSFQTGCYEAYTYGNNYREVHSRGVFANNGTNLYISRNPINLQQQITAFNYSESVTRPTRNSHGGIGGEGSPAVPAHAQRRYNFPLILNSSAHMNIGVMRGALGPQTNMNSEDMGSEHTFSDAKGSYTCILVTGSTGTGGSYGNRRGNLLIRLEDWDDFL